MKLLTQSYLIFIPFVIVFFGKVNFIDSSQIYNFSIAQIFVSSLSSIFLFRFPDEIKKKVGFEILIIISILLVVLYLLNVSMNLNYIDLILIILLLLLKDVSKVATFSTIMNFKLFFLCSLFLVFILFNSNFYIPLAFFPLCLILLFQDFKFIKFSTSFYKLKIKYLIEDLPIHGIMFILTVQSYDVLTDNEYVTLRFIIALCSFSGLIQYILFYIATRGLNFHIFSSNNKLLLSIIPFIITIGLYCLGLNLDVIIVITTLISGFYYFIIKSIFKIKYLLISNIFPLIVFFIYSSIFLVNINTYYFLILISSLIPILFFIYESYREKI
jgi:hypothetical protein